jgi:hypothetical protein
MAKGGPHFPGIRPDDPTVAAQYIKPFGRFSKGKSYPRIYKTKDVGAMWRVVAGLAAVSSRVNPLPQGRRRRIQVASLQVGGCGLGSLDRTISNHTRKSGVVQHGIPENQGSD